MDNDVKGIVIVGFDRKWGNMNEKTHNGLFFGEKNKIKKDELNDIINLSLDLMIVTDMEANILMTNPAWTDILGYSAQELAMINGYNLVHPEDRSKTAKALEGKQKGDILLYTNRLLDKNGEYHHIEWNIRILNDRIYSQGRDITPIVLIDQALKESEERYRLLAENTMDVIFIFNLTQKRFTYITPSIRALTGFTPEEAISRSFNETVVSDYVAELRIKLEHSLICFESDPNDRCEMITEAQWNCKDGSRVWVETSTKFKPNGNDLEIIGVSRNIENRKKTEADLLFISYHDVATGLYNRRYLEEEIRRLNNSRNLPISIIMGDVNRLKQINDRYGHGVGDQLINKAAKVLESSCRPDDLVARWGGDEFVLLLPNTTSDDALRIIERINAAMTNETIENETISLALGVETKTEFKESLDEILRSAEKKMYKEKLKHQTNFNR